MAFIFEEAKSRCTLYNGLNQIEYDEESGGIGYQTGSKIMGIPDGCLPCHRAGWDYGTGFNVLFILTFAYDISNTQTSFLSPMEVALICKELVTLSLCPMFTTVLKSALMLMTVRSPHTEKRIISVT